MHQIHITALTVALVDCLICADCGFVEVYVPSALDRSKMLESFERHTAHDEAGDAADEAPPRG